LVGCVVFVSTPSSFLGSSFLANNPFEAPPAKSPPPALLENILPALLGKILVYISYGLGGSSFLALNNWPENNEV